LCWIVSVLHIQPKLGVYLCFPSSLKWTNSIKVVTSVACVQDIFKVKKVLFAIIFGDLVYAFGLDVLFVKAKTEMKWGLHTSLLPCHVSCFNLLWTKMVKKFTILLNREIINPSARTFELWVYMGSSSMHFVAVFICNDTLNPFSQENYCPPAKSSFPGPPVTTKQIQVVSQKTRCASFSKLHCVYDKHQQLLLLEISGSG
jgi:hypothetical protein